MATAFSSPIDELSWRYLTGVVNEIKSPNTFLSKMLWPMHETVPTENIELSTITRDREMAPLVRKNGPAVLVGGHSTTFQIVSPPNIRIKLPFTPSELLFTRKAGTAIHVTGQTISQAIAAHVAKDLQGMSDMIANTEEYLCSQALQGTLAWNVNDSESYQLTFAIPGANQVTLSTFWDDGTVANVQMEENFMSAKLLASDAVGLNVTDVILGASAAKYFQRVVKAQLLVGTALNWTPFGQVSGGVNLQGMYRDDGAYLLGVFCGVNVWAYARTIPLPGANGATVSTALIRDKYAEFICNTPAAERVMYYGAIADMKALNSGGFQTERFSKSWEEEDPSVMMALLASRPLPCHRRPGSVVSFKVISG